MNEYADWFEFTGTTVTTNPEFAENTSLNLSQAIQYRNYVDVSDNPFYCDCPYPLSAYVSHSDCPSTDITSLIISNRIVGWQDEDDGGEFVGTRNCPEEE